MTDRELLARLQFLVKHSREPREVVIRVDQPSVGKLASEPVRGIAAGIDWDKGELHVLPQSPLVPKEPRHAVFDDGLRLLYMLSGDRGRTGKLTRVAKEVREVFARHGVEPWDGGPLYRDKDKDKV